MERLNGKLRGKIKPSEIEYSEIITLDVARANSRRGRVYLDEKLIGHPVIILIPTEVYKKVYVIK